MSARRQASTTSLTQYARAASPVGQGGTPDFCNSFWGFRDQGFDVLSRRMRGAIHTVEELRNFWKERAAIEEDYAKRMSKLSKFVLGKDEVGDLRRSLDSVRDETDKQATFHLTLAQQIRTELETPCAEFQSKQMHHKKTYLASIEKQCKAKQLQEQHVDKAREKYEQDCMKINSYTAQSSLVQGRDLEKINLKLERAKQSVQANEREFANFTRAFESTVQKWEQDWKAFCDGCQDLEEARMDFMKDNMWAYANLVSTVCVHDDESCERVRTSLEQMETEREIESFVSVYGTGSQIPDPPAFVNHQSPDATPSSAAQPTFRYANFARSSARDVPIQLHRNSTYIPPPTHEEELINTAGRGAGGGGAPRRGEAYTDSNNLARQPIQRNSVYGTSQQQQQQPHVNGTGHSPSSSQNHPNQNQISDMPGPSTSPGALGSSAPLQHRPTNAASSSSQSQPSYRPSPAAHDSQGEPIDPTAKTYIKVGNHAYEVDPLKDPQGNPGLSGSGSGATTRASVGSSVATKQNGVDPLQKQLEELQSGLFVSGNGRRNTIYRGQAQSAAGAGSSGENAAAGPSRHRNDSLSVGGALSRSPPTNSPSPAASGGGSQPPRDYRNSADLVVGPPPVANSRPASPNPPTANFMIPKNSNGPSGTEVVTDVLADYHQRLPGERNGRRASLMSQQMQSPTSANVGSGDGGGYGHGHSLSVGSQQGQGLIRAPSIGHAGIGAHGGQSRGNSPQPPPSRGPSPGPGEIVNAGNIPRSSPQPSPQQQPQQPQHRPPPQHPSQQQRRNSSYITPPSAGTPVRTTSPNTVGIALDPSGRVSHDEMAQRYQMQRGPTPQGHHQAYGGIQQPPQPQPQQQQQRRSSWLAGTPAGAPPPSMAPPVQPAYSPVPPPPPPPPPQIANMYQVPPPPTQQPQQGYMTPAPGQHGMYNQYSQQQQPAGFQHPPPQSQPHSAYAVMNNALVNRQQRANSVGGNGYNGGSVPSSQSSSSLAVRTEGYGASSPGPGAVVHVGRSPSPQPPVHPMPPQIQQIHQMPQQVQQIPMTHQHQHQQQLPVSAFQAVQQQMQGQGQQGQITQGRYSAPPQQPQQQQIGQTTEDGTPILFYVKALYDYQATIEEEFDFQTEDIIAVTATPDDGWWSGELLDEARRQRGRHIFPSNFVCLF